jgi:RNA polymerase nonessential primary-like sigma factor
MPAYLTDSRNERFKEVSVLPIVKPLPMSPGVELAMRASPAWLAAAQMLLADVRNEISDLVGLNDDNSVLVSRQRNRNLNIGRKGDDKNYLINRPSELLIEEPIVFAKNDIESEDEVEFEVSVDELTDDDNTHLGARVGSSLEFYLKQLQGLKAPNIEEETLLVRAAQSGQLDAVNQLVSRSLRIVPAIARTFVGRGMPLEDLIEEGNLGLYRAIPRFDLGLGHRFATYARWWVKHEIRTAVLNEGRLIRLPVHIFKALSRVRRQLESVGHVMPYSTRDPEHNFALPAPSESLRFTLAEAQSLLRLTELPLSLDMPLEGDSENSLVETLPGELDSSPENCVQLEQRTRLLTAAIQQLAVNEREVVMRRYGFLSGKPESLEAIGRSLKLTAERIRQIQKQALLSIQQDFVKRGLSLNELL